MGIRHVTSRLFEQLEATLRRLVRRQLHGRVQTRVDEIAARVGLQGTYRAGGAHDAFTHAYVSARLTLFLGCGLAERMGDLNERFGSLATGDTLGAEMDQHNNAVGRELGSRLREAGTTSRLLTAQRVKRALDAGLLRVLEGAPHS